MIKFNVETCAKFCQVNTFSNSSCRIAKMVDVASSPMKLPPRETFDDNTICVLPALPPNALWGNAHDCYIRALLNNSATPCHDLYRTNWNERMRRLKYLCSHCSCNDSLELVRTIAIPTIANCDSNETRCRYFLLRIYRIIISFQTFR